MRTKRRVLDGKLNINISVVWKNKNKTRQKMNDRSRTTEKCVSLQIMHDFTMHAITMNNWIKKWYTITTIVVCQLRLRHRLLERYGIILAGFRCYCCAVYNPESRW